jgi:hypothetical protein
VPYNMTHSKTFFLPRNCNTLGQRGTAMPWEATALTLWGREVPIGGRHTVADRRTVSRRLT